MKMLQRAVMLGIRSGTCNHRGSFPYLCSLRFFHRVAAIFTLSNQGDKRASPSQLYSLKPQGLLALGFCAFTRRWGLCGSFLPPAHWECPKEVREGFWVKPVLSIFSGNTDQTPKLRRSEEEVGVKNAFQVCGFGNL